MQNDSLIQEILAYQICSVALWDITLLSRNKVHFKNEYKVEVMIEIREVCFTGLLFTYNIWFSERFDEQDFISSLQLPN